MAILGMELIVYVLREWWLTPSQAPAPSATLQIELLLMENVDAHLPTILPPLAAAHASLIVHTIQQQKPVYVSQIMHYLTDNAY